MTIPKIIHYCWFGYKEKPQIVKKCIESWKNKLPEYEIIEWNETNFDIEKRLFTKEAYLAKNYAFVSDYVRVYALYHYGGIYLDTDTEIIKSLDQFLVEESFWGFEEKDFIATSLIGACAYNLLIKEFLEYYDSLSLYDEKGNLKKFTNVLVVTNIFKQKGIQMNGKYQKIEDIAAIYPQEFFSPYDYINCYSKATENSFAIHHFYKSWLPFSTRVKANIKKYLSRIIGGSNVAKLRNMTDRN